MNFKKRTLNAIADMVCGNVPYFQYRTSSSITEFFQDCDTDYVHDGTTRRYWVATVLEEILQQPQKNQLAPSVAFLRVIQNVMDKADAQDGDPDRALALEKLNVEMAREGFEAYYDETNVCFLRHIATNSIAVLAQNPHRPFSATELERRSLLVAYLDRATEDDLICEVLLPLFRQLGFCRVSVAGHKDKALEYGKDIWMKYSLPTQHVLYFGIQAKKGKLDASGSSKGSNVNVAEIHNQATMMLGHEIFDSEIGKKVLVDHAFIVAGGEITKAARNWLGERLDATKRSQIMFMDRDDILNLYIVTNLPLPSSPVPPSPVPDENACPF